MSLVEWTVSLGVPMQTCRCAHLHLPRCTIQSSVAGSKSPQCRLQGESLLRWLHPSMASEESFECQSHATVLLRKMQEESYGNSRNFLCAVAEYTLLSILSHELTCKLSQAQTEKGESR